MFIKTQLFFTYLFLTLFKDIISKEKLLFAWQINRHGARAPYKGVENGIDVFKEKWTQIEELSDIGKRMLYLLGVKNRKRYVNEYNLLSGNYNPQEIFIRSTDVNRTIESIESYLQGLYPQGTGPTLNDKVNQDVSIIYPPNKKYQENFKYIIDHYKLIEDNAALPYKMSIEPIHLFYRPRHEFELYNTDICKGHKEVYEKQKVRQEVSDLGDELLQKFPWFKILEQTDDDKFLRDYWTIYKYMDGFICDDTDQRGFSYLKENFEFNNDTQELLRNYSRKYLWMDYSGTNFPAGHDNISIAANSYTMHSLINWMNKAIEKNPKNESYTKFVIYSAHDASIGALEAFMRYAFDKEMEYSNFAESRYFELYLDENTNEPRVRYIRGDTSVKMDITFEEFKQKIEEKAWSDQKVAEFCQFEDKSKREEDGGGKDQERKEEEKGKGKDNNDNSLSIFFLIFLIIINSILFILIIIVFKKQ